MRYFPNIPGYIKDVYNRNQLRSMNRRFVKDVLAIKIADVKHIEFIPSVNPLVSIIIPIFNKWQFTYNCLKSITEHTAGIEYELIVVDNASSDATSQLFEHIKGVSYIRNQTNVGFARANNQAAKVAKGKYLLFLNNDTTVNSGWLNALINELEYNNQAGIVGGKLLYPNNTIQHAGIFFGTDRVPFHAWTRLKQDDSRVNQRITVPAVTGACLMISRRNYLTVGGFDEQYINGLEDIDLCLKIQRRGQEIVYRPDCVVYHYESISSGRLKYAKQNTSLFFSRWRSKIEPNK